MTYSKDLFILLLFLIVIATGCSKPKHEVDQLERAFYWETSTPLEEGVNPLVIDSIQREIEEGIPCQAQYLSTIVGQVFYWERL